jgi:hypothetical protein
MVKRVWQVFFSSSESNNPLAKPELSFVSRSKRQMVALTRINFMYRLKAVVSTEGAFWSSHKVIALCEKYLNFI